MKKKYLNPSVETMELHTVFAICEGSDPAGGNVQGGGGGDSGREAPHRRVF